jgi:hypothetical protein
MSSEIRIVARAGNGGNPPEKDLPQLPGKVRSAATVAVHARHSN